MKQWFPLLEGDKTPVNHRVVPILHRMAFGKKIRQSNGEIIRMPSVLKQNVGHLPQIKKFRELLFSATKNKTLDRLLLVHWTF